MAAKKFSFILVDGFALMSMAAAVEPLRAANLFAADPLYDIRMLSVAGGPVTSSVGAVFETVPLAEAGFGDDIAFLVAAGDPLALNQPGLTAWLRRADRAGVKLGGISGGSAVLARAGLMTNRRFTVHWHHYDALRALSDGYLLERQLFVIDRDRYTCAGGSAPLDMMHAIIARDHGVSFAQRISDWFIQTEIRVPGARQRSTLTGDFGPLPPPVEAALDLIDSHIADPLTLDQIADLVGLSARQLQRLFADHIGASVMQAYRTVRLQTADRLLRTSALPIGEVAMLTGYSNPAHFASVYRRHFGASPGRVRGDDAAR